MSNANRKKDFSPVNQGDGDDTNYDLLHCAQYGLMGGVKTVLGRSPDKINQQDRSYMTSLHWAAANRNFGMCKYLLSFPEVDMTIPDANGKIAFDHAVDTGSEEIIKLFIMAAYRED